MTVEKMKFIPNKYDYSRQFMEEHGLLDSEMELDVERQLLSGNVDGYGQPVARIRLDTGHTMEITYDTDREQYSMFFYDVDGNRLHMYHADTVTELLKTGKDLQKFYQ